MIKVLIKSDGVTASVRAGERKFSGQELSIILERLALIGKTNILRRTGEGVDFHDRPFVPYSPSYKEYRHSKGRPTGKVDLNFTGRMLGSLRTKASRHQASIFFGRAEEAKKAAGHDQGLGHLKHAERNFFAISQKDAQEFGREIDEWLDEGFSG